jgi:hypothetical protein
MRTARPNPKILPLARTALVSLGLAAVLAPAAIDQTTRLTEVGLTAPRAALQTLTTTASPDTTLGDGETLTDTAVLTSATDAGSILFQLFGPDNATCTLPAVFESTVTAPGSGTFESEPFTPTAAGTYQWVATYTAGDETISTDCGDPDETTVVSQANPTLVTHASRDTFVGKRVFDTATLAGGVDPTGTITFDLYGPGDATCSRTPVFSTTVPVDGDGDYRSRGFKTSVPGTYQWIASYSGDENNAAVSTECGDPKEKVVVRHKKPYGDRPRP